MKCEAAEERVNAWIDGELPPDELSALEAHLAECGRCRETAEAIRLQDRELRQAAAPIGAAAQRVAERALVAFNAASTLPAAASPTASSTAESSSLPTRWISLLLACAAGFLLAAFLFQPWKPDRRADHDALDGDAAATTGLVMEQPIAQLVVATGNVEVREPGSSEWRLVSELQFLTCPTDSDVRTGADARCELKTADGCIVRLNDETEVSLAAGDTLRIQRGQIWCSAPDNIALKVVAAEARSSETGPAWTGSPSTGSPALAADGAWSAACPPSASMMTAVQRDGAVQVTTSAGEVEVRTLSKRERLKRGETASVAAGSIVRTRPDVDPLLAARWMHPLLMRKGHGNKDLDERVNQLLAQLGESKVTWLYEQEIRSLGEYATLPLLRYAQSSGSRDNPQRRQTALRIVSDMAPTWAIADLIGLLADDDAEARVLAAGAIARLTGLDQGRSPEQWRMPLGDCRPTIELWQQWWQQNGRQYPPPAVTPL